MVGCEPSSTVGLKKVLTKRFAVEVVDEHLTSKTCNRCMNQLENYSKLKGLSPDSAARTAGIPKTDPNSSWTET